MLHVYFMIKDIETFRVSINGMCKDWSFYQTKIKYPELLI